MRRLFRTQYFPFLISVLLSGFLIALLPLPETVSSESRNSTSHLRQKETIQKIRLLDNNNGYALTTRRLLSTEDNGETWSDITPRVSDTQNIYDAFFLDESNGRAVLSSGNLTTILYIAITNDGGKSWSNQPLNLRQETLNEFGGIVYIDFVDSTRGWLMLKQMTGSNFSRGNLFLTEDGGKSWRELGAPPIGDKINFISQNAGWLAGGAGGDELYETRNGGKSWQKKDIANGIYDLPTFTSESDGILPVRISNEIAFYQTRDGGESWHLSRKAEANDELSAGFAFPSSVANDGALIAALSRRSLTKLRDEQNRVDVTIENASKGEAITQLSFTNESNGFVLTTTGRCESFKTNCIQETRLLSTKDGGSSLQDSTPTLLLTPEYQLENFLPVERLTSPPGGSTHLSNKLGFDKCTAAPFNQMTIWWNTSPFYDVNIYIGGQNRGCTQAQLTPTWVDQISTQGWGLIPTWVGLQSPCSGCTSCAKHSTDNTAAEQQGRAEADAAHTAAVNLGMDAGTIVYFDMERYTVPNPDTNNCRASTRAFLNGWTQRMHELNDKSGVYGSPCNAIQDWTPGAIANSPDAVWLARWWLPPRLFFFGTAADGCDIASNWSNHQRIHQYQGGHDETWGGVTFNIDRDASDATVAGSANTIKTAFHLPPADFDGDGKTDVSVFRPDTGAWYVLQSSNGAFFGAPFGVSTDKLMPGDYDGDGWVDFGVYRPEEGNWYQYLRRSISAGFNQYRIFNFGLAEDIPVTDDFDGDARTDFAVFRPGTGTWYVYNQSDRTVSITQFGSTGDVPVAGDYDGDGKADVAVWRPGNGAWFILYSGNGSVSVVSFGISTDKPVEGDYDGDGKWDLGVYRPSEGLWYMLRSTEGFGVISFGLAEDIPATGDYDGDKKYDQAVFRPSTGVWYVNRSQQGFYAVQFGQAGDKPIPAMYTGSGQLP